MELPAFIFGSILTIFMWLAIDALVGIEGRKAENNIVWISKDDNLTCRKNDNYPQLNCQLIKEAIGPKLIDKPDNEIVIDEEN